MQRRDRLSAFEAAKSITSQVIHSDATTGANANREMRAGKWTATARGDTGSSIRPLIIHG